jgi:hypothetical protein
MKTKILSTILFVASIAFGSLVCEQILRHDELVRTLKEIEVSKKQEYETQLKRLESELPELQSRVRGSLLPYFVMFVSTLVGSYTLSAKNKQPKRTHSIADFAHSE